jgi:hypothetical protein
MSVRNNQERMGVTNAGTEAPPVQAAVEKAAQVPYAFPTPTEFIDLPSEGKFYPEDHPLHEVDSVEVRFMTAKDEDILSSPSLLRKGLALDRFLQNILIDKRIKVDDLLVGDKNALIVGARMTGYGSDYNTKVVCPSCTTTQEYSFNLEESLSEINYSLLVENGIEFTDQQTLKFTLPKTGYEVEVKLLNGHDERKLMSSAQRRKKLKMSEATLTDQLKTIIVSVNGNTDSSLINRFVDSMPAIDSRHLRGEYAKSIPNIDLSQYFSCNECQHEQDMEVPFTVDFFWPGR